MTSRGIPASPEGRSSSSTTKVLFAGHGSRPRNSASPTTTRGWKRPRRSPPAMTEKAELEERIESSYNDLMALIHSLGPTGLAITGSAAWAFKDHLIHRGAGELSLMGLPESADRPTAMGVPGVEHETEAINRAVWTLHRDKSPDEAVAFFAGTHALLLSTLDSLSDAGLRLPYSHNQ